MHAHTQTVSLNPPNAPHSAVNSPNGVTGNLMIAINPAEVQASFADPGDSCKLPPVNY